MKNIKEMIEYPQEGILSKEILKNDKVDIGLFCMAKGTEMSNHTSIRPAFVHVIEGRGVFNLEGKDIEMKEGVIIPMEADAVHGLKAEENTTFILGLY
jgi:quercetin dioxygenase-like cupin family protein